MKNTGKIAMGFLFGTALGATLGVLFAPKKGTKTRAFISDKAKKVSDTVNRNYGKAKNMLSHKNVNEAETVFN